MNIKNVLFCILFSVAFNTNGWTQQMLVENFDNADCGGNTCTCCVINIINDDICLPGWSSSHGSPNTINNEDNLQNLATENLTINGQAVMMSGPLICEGPRGEGLFTNFNFEKGACYKISFRISTNTTFGSFDVHADNGLNHISGCCGTIQTNDPEVINSIPLNSLNTGDFNDWATIDILYTPTENFSQFQFFSRGGWVIVDDLSISKVCPPEILFTDSEIDIPANNYHAANKIIAGTLFLEGFIDSDPNNTTELKAGEFIKIIPQTHITVNGENHFLIKTEPCSSSSECPVIIKPPIQEGGNGILTIINPEGKWEAGPKPIKPLFQGGNGNLELSMKKEEQGNNLQRNIEIYPNPNSGQFTLKLPEIIDKNTSTEVKIYNQFGKLVYQKLLINSTLDLNLSQIPSGIYIVNAKVNNQVYTERLIIQ